MCNTLTPCWRFCAINPVAGAFFERTASKWRTLRTLRQQYSREIWPTCRFIRTRVVISKNKVTYILTKTEGVVVNGGNGTTRQIESIEYTFTCARPVFTFARQILGHVGGGLRWKIPSLWSVKGADKVACPAPGRNAMKAIRLDPPEARRFFFCCSPFRQSVSAGGNKSSWKMPGNKKGQKTTNFLFSQSFDGKEFGQVSSFASNDKMKKFELTGSVRGSYEKCY